MKRNYFIFCGFAVAYCVNVLVAMQIKNFYPTSSAVYTPAVSLSLSDQTIGDYKKYTGKKKTAKDCSESYYSCVDNYKRIRTSRERDFMKSDFKNIHNESFKLSSIPVYNPIYKMISFISSCKLHINFESSDPLYVNVESRQQGRTSKYSSEDSKSLQGFDVIIQFSG